MGTMYSGEYNYSPQRAKLMKAWQAYYYQFMNPIRASSYISRKVAKGKFPNN